MCRSMAVAPAVRQRHDRTAGGGHTKRLEREGHGGARARSRSQMGARYQSKAEQVSRARGRRRVVAGRIESMRCPRAPCIPYHTMLYPDPTYLPPHPTTPPSQNKRLLEIHLRPDRQLRHLRVVALRERVARVLERLAGEDIVSRLLTTRARRTQHTCRYEGFGSLFMVSRKAQDIAPTLRPWMFASALVWSSRPVAPSTMPLHKKRGGGEGQRTSAKHGDNLILHAPPRARLVGREAGLVGLTLVSEALEEIRRAGEELLRLAEAVEGETALEEVFGLGGEVHALAEVVDHAYVSVVVGFVDVGEFEAGA